MDDPDNGRNLMGFFTGSADYEDKTMARAMNQIEVSYNPHYILYEPR